MIVQMVEARVPSVGERVPVLLDGRKYRLEVLGVTTTSDQLVQVWLRDPFDEAGTIIGTIIVPA